MTGTSKGLMAEIKRCKTVQDCIKVATSDCYDQFEEIEGWITCLEEIFKKGMPVKVLGVDAEFVSFELVNYTCLAAKCRKGRKVARVAPESLELLHATKLQSLWLRAWAAVARSVVSGY